jgi:hypothetical protein
VGLHRETVQGVSCQGARGSKELSFAAVHEEAEMTPQNLIQAFANAVAHEEGFFVEGSIPQRANNPGDLGNGDIGNGVIQTEGPNGVGITIYTTAEDGWNALLNKVARMLNGSSEVYLLSMTIQQVGSKYSGSATWGENVAKMLGVTPQTTLAEYVSQPPAGVVETT